MGILKSLVLIIVLTLAGVFLYRYLRGNVHALEQFQSISKLTPEDLYARCGDPTQDMNGVVVENDGIRDLSYHDSGGAALVFRFISDDGRNWVSMGAWEQVNGSDDLGDPVAAADAARRLSCAVKSQVNTSSMSIPHESARGGTAAYLAVILQDMPLTLPHTPPASMPVPMPATLPNTAPAHSPTPTTLPDPEPYSDPGPSSESGFDSNSGSGSDGPSARARVILPCASENGPCEMLGYGQFVAEFHQAIQAERENDFERAMALLTEHGVMVVQLPSLEASRAGAIKAIVQLEVRTINIVEAHLRDDVAHLEPFESDSSQIKAQKMALVEHADQERRQMWKDAIESNRPAAGTSDSSSGRTFRFNSEAYQQLVQIHLSGNWP